MIEILLEHAWFLVINKPSGLLTQAVPGIPSLQTQLVDQLLKENPNSPTPFIGIPHRLDRVTSGVMVVARNQRALRRLSDQFATRKVNKLYHALVPKIELDESTTYRDMIRKVPNEARAEIVAEHDEGAKEAILHYRVLSQHVLGLTNISGVFDPSYPVSLIEIGLETGRMHQIRLQFAARNQPILGDVLYGSPWRWLQFEPGEREAPIALHASSIDFHNPQNAERVSVTAPHPIAWQL